MVEKVKKIITSYENPDLDGVASAIAYAEFLQKTGVNAEAGIFGNPHPEAQYVLQKCGAKTKKLVDLSKDEYSDVVLVDAASDLDDLFGVIDKTKISEIVDHRAINISEEFSEAKKEIELVGACATLIAKKFYETKTIISNMSALLLFTAIASHTANFKSKVTTDKDLHMAEWLKNNFDLTSIFITDVFETKSSFDEPLKQIFLGDFATFEFTNLSIGIAQLEIINVNKFIEENYCEIKDALENIKKEKNLDIIFLTCLDLKDGYNMFFVVDVQTENLLSSVLEINFDDCTTRKEGLLLRKEITVLLKEYLGGNSNR